MLGEVEREEYQRAADLSIPNPIVNMIVSGDRNNDPRRYNITNVNKVAMIFHNTDGEQALQRDSEIFFIWIIKKDILYKNSTVIIDGCILVIITLNDLKNNGEKNNKMFFLGTVE